MKNRLFATLIIAGVIAPAQSWQLALPGYVYSFPRDYFDHRNFETEWWYYTGNLHAPNGHRYGFELTFFRQAVRLTARTAESENLTWKPDQLYLAHLALSDINGGAFYHTERLNRAGPGLTGISVKQQRYWNGNWQVHWKSLVAGDQQLQAVCDRFTLVLNLKPQKPIVIHGRDGISRKGPAPGEASHYTSFTRIAATGRLEENGTSIAVEGLAWMDHEFFSEVHGSGFAGWDWFSIQLDSGDDLMLYRLRDASGNETPYSSGTYVNSRGDAQFLSATQFSLTAGETWRSAASGATYPITWTVRVPSLDLYLSERTDLKNQELFTKGSISPVYWEGSVDYVGQLHGRSVKGIGYLEMTGYVKREHLASATQR